MEFRKMVMITLYSKQKKRHRCTEQTFGLCGRRRGWDVSREQIYPSSSGLVILDVVNLFPLPADVILSSTSRGRWRSTDEEGVVFPLPGACLLSSFSNALPGSFRLSSLSIRYAASQNLSGFLVSFISPPTQHPSSSSFLPASPSRGSTSANFEEDWSRRACKLVIQYIWKILRWFFFSKKKRQMI